MEGSICLHWINQYSGYGCAYPVSATIHYFNIPCSIGSDQGTQLAAKAMQHGACVYGTVLPVTTHHLEAAALTEDCSGEGWGSSLLG